MTETLAEIIHRLAAIGLAGMSLYQCWTQRMRLLPVAVTAGLGLIAWWALSPSVVTRLIEIAS